MQNETFLPEDANKIRETSEISFFVMSSSVVTDLGSLLHTLPPELKHEVRKLEKVSVKLVKSDCRELFNSVCVREKLYSVI